MKTSRILVLTLVSLSNTFISAYASLPPCRDCDAELNACYAQADSNFNACIQAAKDVYQTALDAINQETQNLIDSNCGKDDGGLIYSGCVVFWTSAAEPAIATAFALNQIDRSLCRTDRNREKITCDTKYLLCCAEVASARRNCECQ